jgi:predicted MPP superfamily phosphohydrolase
VPGLVSFSGPIPVINPPVSFAPESAASRLNEHANPVDVPPGTHADLRPGGTLVGSTPRSSGATLRLRVVAPWLVSWAFLTLVGSWAQYTLNFTADHLHGPLATEPIRAAASLLVLPTQCFSVASSILLDHRTDMEVVSTVIAVAIGWACWLLALAILLFARRQLRGRTRLATGTTPGANAPANPARRAFLLDGPLALGGVAVTGASAHSVLVEPFNLRVERYTIPIRDLPASLSGLRLLQISDTHLGPFVPPEFIERVVARAIELAPDAFLLTGDYVHRRTDCNRRAADLFRPLVATGRSVLGVLGNHDWFGDGTHMASCLTAAGIRMIDNARVYIDAASRALTDSPPASGLCIAGLGDFSKDAMDVAAALGGVPLDMPRILLQHQPDAAEDPAILTAPRIDLMLSGHTHGGQIRFPILGAPVTLSRYGQKYAGGLAQGPRCPVIVSRGLGMSFLPVRIGVRPELVLITLIPA